MAPAGFIGNTLKSNGIGFITSPFSSGVLVEGVFRDVVAHEISHGYPFLLCDEHNMDNTWEIQDDNRRIGNFGSGCPNGDRDNDNNLDNECNGGCPVTTFGKLVNQPTQSEVNLKGYMGTDVYPNVWSPFDSYNGTIKGFERGFLGKIAQRVLMFTGTIFKNGTVELDTSYIIESGLAITNDEILQGNTTINLTDNQNKTLFYLNFSPTYSTNPKNESGDLETNFSYFSFMLPINESLNRIKIAEQGTIIKEVNRTVNTPIINITTQLQNQIFDQSLTITWNASDADNDTLNYAILISSDNSNTFSTVEIDYSNTTLLVNTTNFINSHEYKIKILATDGINTGNDTTETFTISNPVPPTVTLVSPQNNNVSSTGNIIFNCSATDFNENLENITLYNNISGLWQADETKNITGSSDYETFTINNIPSRNYIWNCFAYDNTSLSDWGDSNFTINVNVTTLPDINKLSIKNSTGGVTAWLSDSGNIFLKGNLEIYSNYQKTANDELIMIFNEQDVLIIDKENGSMYLKGNILENQNTFNIKDNSDEWIIKDTNGNVVLYVNESGYVFMKGTITANKITGYKNSFVIKDALGNNAARFDDAGNVVLKGTLEQNSNYQRTSNDEWIINNNGNDVFILDTLNGSLYIDGTLFQNQTALNPKEGSDDFIVKNEFGNAVGYVNESGSMFLRGALTQNSIP